MTLQLRSELVATARRMSELGLAPGMSGNVSVRTESGLLVTPSGMPYAELTPEDVVELAADGSWRCGQRVPTSEWPLHREMMAARLDVNAVVHTHSPFCTVLSCLRRPIPGIHYMVVLAGNHEIPCAEYATYGSAELALNVVRALGTGRACLLSNHGMVAVGASLASALHLAAEVETLASLYWHAKQLGQPFVLDGEELARVGEQFASYGQDSRRDGCRLPGSA